MKNEFLRVYASTAQAPPDAKQYWRFENSADADEATLYVYGDIVTYDLEDWNWPDDVVPNKFKNELNELGDVKTIHVRINSNGGSVFAAYAIMNLLKSHKAQIIVHNDGIAASAATIVAMAGDKIFTALGSVWMFHLPLLSLWGMYNLNDLNRMGSALTTIAESMLDIYNARTGIERAELEKMLNEETWLTGTQAKEKGFADEVTDMEVAAYVASDKHTAVFNGLSVNISKVRNKDKLLSMLKEQPAPVNTPQAKPAEAAAAPTPPPQAAPINQNEEQEENIMTLEELKAKYPDIYTAAVNEGVAQGTQAERNRIQEIDNMALPGMDALTNKAKYETGVTAGEFAVELIKAQKQKGVNYLNKAQEDAAPLSTVPAAAAPQSDDAQEEQALLAKTGERAKTLR